MLEVSRHETFADYSVRCLDRLSEDLVSGVEEVQCYSAALSLQFLAALGALGHRTVLDPAGGSRETWLSLRTALDTGAAIFTVAAAAKGVVPVRMDDRTVRLDTTGPVYYANAKNWLTTLWLAIVARDAGVIERLARFSIVALRQSGTAAPEYSYDMVRMLQLFFRGERGADVALGAALEAGKPAELADRYEREVANQLRFPEMELFHYLLSDSTGERFNKALANALTGHLDYWSVDDDRLDSPSGYIALGPLALAVMAQDAGIAISVRSEYLPSALLDGTALTEHG
ncbi:Immunity protein 49 [Nonomuraea solani]|uniref:Immunity protein 49 n=2 Tax=Nonomuraea solani TaxID=1144553 RepID=A0A1H6EU65_9ACTN|nr:Immunity protein 49 [Nonomuraea solani]